jgi:type II secretory pathway pseudopilin PulG
MPIVPKSVRLSRAFTVIELLVVIGLYSVLSGIVFGSVQSAKRWAAVARARAEISLLALGLEEYKRHFGDYPPSERPDALALALVVGWHPADRAGSAAGGPAFVDISKLTLDLPREEGGARFAPPRAFLDPWGGRYLYYYRMPSAVASGPQSTSESQPDPGRFLLLSPGPDRMTTRLPLIGANPGFPAVMRVNDDDILAK